MNNSASQPDKFKNKNGDISQYALACGYIQATEIPHLSVEVSLWQDEGTTNYNVRAYPRNSNTTGWLSFDNLTEARKEFKQMIKDLKAGKTI